MNEVYRALILPNLQPSAQMMEDARVDDMAKVYAEQLAFSYHEADTDTRIPRLGEVLTHVEIDFGNTVPPANIFPIQIGIVGCPVDERNIVLQADDPDSNDCAVWKCSGVVVLHYLSQLYISFAAGLQYPQDSEWKLRCWYRHTNAATRKALNQHPQSHDFVYGSVVEEHIDDVHPRTMDELLLLQEQ